MIPKPYVKILIIPKSYTKDFREFRETSNFGESFTFSIQTIY